MNEFTCLVFLYDCSEVSVGYVYDRTFINKIFTNGDKATAMKFKKVLYPGGLAFFAGGLEEDRAEVAAFRLRA
ncbi:hypothetical protein BKM20_18460 [Pseudomonas avellanae]|nr:hypothetical protein BKM20_18460 [Pseudomonas avellanae]